MLTCYPHSLMQVCGAALPYDTLRGVRDRMAGPCPLYPLACRAVHLFLSSPYGSPLHSLS